jgi:hypothetical protein
MGSEWIIGRLAGEGSEVDSGGSAWGLVAGSCEHGDEPLSSGTTKLVS